MTKNVSLGLISWYSYRNNSKILLIPTKEKNIDAWNDAISYFETLDVSVNVVDDESIDNVLDSNDEKYDYIISVGCLEETDAPIMLLNKLFLRLTEDGVALIGCYNKLGMGNFCEGRKIRDVLLGRNSSENRKYYSKFEIEQFAKTSEFGKCECYAILPGFEKTQILLADGYMPNEYIMDRFDKYADNSLNALFDKYDILEDLLNNDLFYKMNDQYLLEFRKVEHGKIYNQVTVSAERDKSRAYATLIADKKVIKKAIYKEGMDRLKLMNANHQYLKTRGINVVTEKIEKDYIEMPYIEGISLVVYLQELIKQDLEKFFSTLDWYRELVFSSSEIVETTEFGPILRKGLLDLVPLNILCKDGNFVVIDQEYSEDNYPANAIFFRGLCCVYSGRRDLDEIYRFDDLLSRYGLLEKRIEWDNFALDFLEKVGVSHYYLKREELMKTTCANNLQKLCNEIAALDSRWYLSPDDLDGKEVYIFGTGKYAEYFYDEYSKRVRINAAIDNDPQRMGADFHNIPIFDIYDLKEELLKDESVIAICVKRFEPIAWQLVQEEFINFRVYRPNEKDMN